MRFFIEYFTIVIYGIISIIKRILSFCLKIWSYISTTDRVLLISTFISVPFLVGGWRSYYITFSEEYSYFHKISTDDLLIFLFLKIIIFLSIFWLSFFNKYKVSIKIIQYISVLGLVFIFLLNYMFPEKITPSKETNFTWQFYHYGVMLVFILISSFLGAKPRKHGGSLSPDW